MAITDSTTKSIVLLLGITLVGAIFVVGTAVFSNQKETVEFTSRPYSEPESGLVFDAPLDWKVGMGTSNLLQVRGFRVEKISSQRDTCSNVSEAVSSDVERALTSSQQTAVEAWRVQFPGLAYAATTNGRGGEPVLVGVDSCSPSFNRQLLTFRGQTYRDEIEIRFAMEFVLEEELTQAQIDQLAKDLGAGRATDYQAEFNAFRSVLESSR